jgi:hypothetical protein
MSCDAFPSHRRQSRNSAGGVAMMLGCDAGGYRTDVTTDPEALRDLVECQAFDHREAVALRTIDRE